MKSVKPGRGPSGMAFIGSVIAVLFGILWIFMASSIIGAGQRMTDVSGLNGFGLGLDSSPMDTAATIFPLFGLLFIVGGIASAIYHYKNTRGRERFSLIDIVDKTEEGDPADAFIKGTPSGKQQALFCPDCGKPLEAEYTFCPGCGRRLPREE